MSAGIAVFCVCVVGLVSIYGVASDERRNGH